VIGLGASEKTPAVLLTDYSISCTVTTDKDYCVSGISVNSENGKVFGVTGHTVAAEDKRVFTNCTGGTSSFGGGGGGIASSTFTNCTGGNSVFGGGGVGGTASGAFTNCTGRDYSFGSGGTASGTFINCTGGLGSFGSIGVVAATARIISCRLTTGTFNSSPASGAIIRLSLDGTDTEVNAGP